jgi:hypothetical protein
MISRIFINVTPYRLHFICILGLFLSLSPCLGVSVVDPLLTYLANEAATS